MSKKTKPTQAQAWLELPGGKIYWLGRECKIGRSKESNDLVFNERPVSSRHLIINTDANGCSLIDQQSTNGTYLNGLLIQKASVLKDGDEIRLAKVVTLRFRCTREQRLDSPRPAEKTTIQVNQLDTRECWLLLADMMGYSGCIAKLGSEVALQRLQAWIAEMRPLIEGNGGSINCYVGDGIFAYWPCAIRTTEQVLEALRALENYRRRAAQAFRLVLHHGQVLFTKSSLGEELLGQDVNFVFRAEKIAKRFICPAMLSQAAVKSLHLEGCCESAGTSAVDGIQGYFTFYRVPREIADGAAPREPSASG